MSGSPQARGTDMGTKNHRSQGGSSEASTLKASPEVPPTHQFGKTIPVVYYLCRNRHLEHPHFIEVPLSSSHGFLLRDFIERLSVLRGKGMPSLYSWSCKRSYKDGFVWHDLNEDDLIYHTNRNEYILKGSELLEDIRSAAPSISLTSRQQQNTPSTLVRAKQQNDSSPASASSSSLATGKLTWSSASSPMYAGPEDKLFKAVKSRTNATDATTQTNEAAVRQTCSRGVSTEEQEDPMDDLRYAGLKEPVRAEPPSCSVSSGETEKPETLEALINADRKLRVHRVVPEESEADHRDGFKPKVTDLLMQLISCVSICLKDNGLGIVPSYQTRVFTGDSERFGDLARFPSKPNLGLMCELDSLCENPRPTVLELEDKESFSILETKKQNETVNSLPSLQRFSSDHVERASEAEAKQEQTVAELITAAQTKSPMTSSCNVDATTRRCSRHITDGPSSRSKSSRRSESFREEEMEKVIKTEESFLQVLGL